MLIKDRLYPHERSPSTEYPVTPTTTEHGRRALPVIARQAFVRPEIWWKECKRDGSQWKSEAAEKECRTSGGRTDIIGLRYLRYEQEQNGGNWLRNHLWCPNDPRGEGIDDDDDDEIFCNKSLYACENLPIMCEQFGLINARSMW